MRHRGQRHPHMVRARLRRQVELDKLGVALGHRRPVNRMRLPQMQDVGRTNYGHHAFVRTRSGKAQFGAGRDCGDVEPHPQRASPWGRDRPVANEATVRRRLPARRLLRQ